MSKKYQSIVTQNGDQWTAKITRQVTSRKTTVTKEQGGFKSEDGAQEWADSTLAELISTQKTANSRQGQQRKEQEEIKLQRSARRADKTEAAKLAKAEQLEQEAQDAEPEFGAEE